MRHAPLAGRPHGAAVTPGGGLALVVLGAVCWGVGGLAGARLGAAADVGALAVAAYRLLGGGVAVLLGVVVVEAVRPRGRLRVTSRAAWTRVALLAVLVAVFQAAYFGAVFRVGVAVATLVTLGTAPVLVAGAGAARRRRLPGARTLVALLSAVVGLFLLVLAGSARAQGAGGEGSAPGVVRPDGASARTGAGGRLVETPADPVLATNGPPGLVGPGTAGADLVVGVGLALLAAVAFAGLVVVNRRAVRGLGPIVMTGVSFTAGGVLLVPLAAGVGGLALPSTGLGWGWLVVLALVPTALAYALFFTGLPAAGATPAALAALLEPLTATFLAVLVLDERLTVAGWCAAVLLVVAVVLSRPRTGTSPTMVLGPRAVRGRRPAPVPTEVDEPWE